MIDIPSFLMRWFFLSSLVRDPDVIQELPYDPHPATPHNAYHHHPPAYNEGNHPVIVSEDFKGVDYPYQHQHQQYYDSGYYQAHQGHCGQHRQHHQYQEQAHLAPLQYPQLVSHAAPAPYRDTEEEWRDHVLRGIRSYPQGHQRKIVMDGMRGELVQQLNQYLNYVDSTMHRIREYQEALNRKARMRQQQTVSKKSESNVANVSDTEDPYQDQDVEIVKKFEKGIMTAEGNHTIEDRNETAVLVVSKEGTRIRDADVRNPQQIPDLEYEEPITQEEIILSRHALNEIREYLPQIVSAVLKSPEAFDPALVDPVRRLRELIISRCQKDPSWGIELCWLLEAEVGRAWKKLFEHRQQTGKRLIVVLPAEKAAVLAKIGTEKREAFDLLQDAERVTAYGYSNEEYWHGGIGDSSRSRLPSSLSLLRCSHFGDTMHFIDRLTQISLDLRAVPTIERNAYLEASLYEMNRRIRRRMVTSGEVSLDVEDARGPFDWPSINDLTLDMLKYSVHLPLKPSQGNWPSGSIGESESGDDGGVMQVLNIVVQECRILSSRERCPYLVRLEVVETGLEGGDARIYAEGATRVGLTAQEALVAKASGAPSNKTHYQDYFQNLDMPQELVETRGGMQSVYSLSEGSSSDSAKSGTMFRGGWEIQANDTDYFSANPYDMARQHEYEELHHHLHETEIARQASQLVPADRKPVTTGEALLTRVFGKRWRDVCDEVRKSSPYGHLKGWRLASFILKAGEDIRREALVMQLITKFRDWFEAEIPENDRPYLRPYTIKCVGGDAGLLECLTDAKSVDEVKKNCDGFLSLRDYFERAYGPPTRNAGNRIPTSVHGLSFEEAQDNFLRSLVGYSLVCYVLQIKDRHNANILLDRAGHLIHIDFGFVLGDTPRMGKVPLFSERAPFKLSAEFWDVLGGWNVEQGGLGARFCKMFAEAFACASKHNEEIANLVEGIMLTLTDSPAAAKISANRVRSRLRMRGDPHSKAHKMFIIELIDAAKSSWGTSTYDWLQKNMNGYQ